MLSFLNRLAFAINPAMTTIHKIHKTTVHESSFFNHFTFYMRGRINSEHSKRSPHTTQSSHT